MLRPRPRAVAHVTRPLLKVSAAAQMGVVLLLRGEEVRQLWVEDRHRDANMRCKMSYSLPCSPGTSPTYSGRLVSYRARCAR